MRDSLYPQPYHYRPRRQMAAAPWQVRFVSALEWVVIGLAIGMLVSAFIFSTPAAKAAESAESAEVMR